MVAMLLLTGMLTGLPGQNVPQAPTALGYLNLHERGPADQAAVDAAAHAYRDATRKFQMFWDTKRMSN